MIDRSQPRDTPLPSMALEVARVFGTRGADAILASGPQPHLKAAHMIAIEPIHQMFSSCEKGAVHIWG